MLSKWQTHSDSFNNKNEKKKNSKKTITKKATTIRSDDSKNALLHRCF